MEQVILVSGQWIFSNNRWLFVVDSKSGCRILQANSKTTYGDFIEMVYEDYGLDKRVCTVELSYMFPKKVLQKLPPDTPPVIIGNCRQFHGFLGQSQSETIRLCVEVKEKHLVETEEGDDGDFMSSKTDRKRPRGEVNNNDDDNNVGDNSENEEEDDETRFDYCDDSDGTDSDDENFCKYGTPPKVNEDHANSPTKKSNSTIFLNQPNDFPDFINLEMASVNIAVGQCFATKEQLETRLKILTVVQKFDFRVDKSTPDLLTVKCWVKGCTWRVRAAPKLNSEFQFHVRVYVAEHTCSVTERSASARQATPDILAMLYKDFVGGIGPTIRPMHVAEALTKRFQIKVVTTPGI